MCVLAGSVQAQTFNSLAAFGGSLSDSCNLAQSRGLPTGTSFTTDPDPAGPGIAAQAFGASATNSRAGGSNHAWDGGCDKIGFWVPKGAASILLAPVPRRRPGIEGSFIEKRNRASGEHARPGYLPPCPGGRGHKYLAKV